MVQERLQAFWKSIPTTCLCYTKSLPTSIIQHVVPGEVVVARDVRRAGVDPSPCVHCLLSKARWWGDCKCQVLIGGIPNNQRLYLINQVLYFELTSAVKPSGQM